MDVCLLIKGRLAELGLEQRELAAATDVTDSYISQLLTRKKLPPAPNRTDIYEKIGRFLRLSSGTLEELAHEQRRDALKRGLEGSAVPLFRVVRELILRKCAAEKRQQIAEIFEKQPFGDLERLITQKLFDVIARVATAELENEAWLRDFARLSGREYEQMRVITLEFLDSDVFSLDEDSCICFLDPLIESWDIDLATFNVEIVLNKRLVPRHTKKLAFVETESDDPIDDEPGLIEFLQDPALRGNATEEEIGFMRRLRFKGKRPSSLYYYRELQSLRDPLHFPESKKR